jgi:hypothetical protein
MAMPWSFVSKITNSKHQIPNKLQIPIFNDQNLPGRDIVWIFEFWSRAAQALAPRVGNCLTFVI